MDLKDVLIVGPTFLKINNEILKKQKIYKINYMF